MSTFQGPDDDDKPMELDNFKSALAWAQAGEEVSDLGASDAMLDLLFSVAVTAPGSVERGQAIAACRAQYRAEVARYKLTLS